MPIPEDLDAKHRLPFEHEDAGGISVEEAGESLFDVLDSADDDEESSADEPRSDASEELEEDDFDEIFDGVVEGEEDEDAGYEEELEEDDDLEEEYDEEGEDEDLETYTVTVDGEEKEVTFDDLVSNYSLSEASHKRFQEAAELRKETKAEKEALREARSEYLQRLELAEQVVEQSIPEEPDWEELRKSNPAEYAALREDYRQAKEDRRAIVAERERVQQEALEDYREQIQEAQKAAREKLQETVDGWDNPEALEEGLHEVSQYATTTYGWSPQQLAQVTDPNMIIALRKAMKYDQLENEGEEIRKKVKKKRRNLKPSGRKRTGKRSRQGKKKQKRAMDRVAQTGRTEDAADAIRTLL